MLGCWLSSLMFVFPSGFLSLGHFPLLKFPLTNVSTSKKEMSLSFSIAVLSQKAWERSSALKEKAEGAEGIDSSIKSLWNVCTFWSISQILKTCHAFYSKGRHFCSWWAFLYPEQLWAEMFAKQTRDPMLNLHIEKKYIAKKNNLSLELLPPILEEWVFLNRDLPLRYNLLSLSFYYFISKKNGSPGS